MLNADSNNVMRKKYLVILFCMYILYCYDYSSRRDSKTSNQSELMIYLHKYKRLTTEVVQRKAGTGSGVSDTFDIYWALSIYL